MNQANTVVHHYFKTTLSHNASSTEYSFTTCLCTGGTLYGWRAVDIHTGEIVWERTPGETGNERIDWGHIFNYNNYQEFGSAAHLYSAPGAGGFGGAAANWFGVYDPFTGRWLANVTDVPSTSKIINYDASLRGEVVGY